MSRGRKEYKDALTSYFSREGFQVTVDYRPFKGEYLPNPFYSIIVKHDTVYVEQRIHARVLYNETEDIDQVMRLMAQRFSEAFSEREVDYPADGTPA